VGYLGGDVAGVDEWFAVDLSSVQWLSNGAPVTTIHFWAASCAHRRDPVRGTATGSPAWVRFTKRPCDDGSEARLMEIVSGHNGPNPKMAHVYCPKREGLPASRDGQELPSETRRTSRAASGCSKKGSSRRPRSCAAASHAASHLGHTQPRLERVGRVGRPWLRGLAAHVVPVGWVAMQGVRDP